MSKVLDRQDKLLTITPVKMRAKSACFFMSIQATGAYLFGCMRPFSCGAQLPIIYLNPIISNGLGYVKPSSLMPYATLMGRLRHFFFFAQLPIIYTKSFILKDLVYIKPSSLMPYTDSERGRYEAFSL